VLDTNIAVKDLPGRKGLLARVLARPFQRYKAAVGSASCQIDEVILVGACRHRLLTELEQHPLTQKIGIALSGVRELDNPLSDFLLSEAIPTGKSKELCEPFRMRRP
jgi:hypothetical protein